MTTARLEGKKIADRILDDARAIAGKLPRAAGFAAIMVGDDPASKVYVTLKERACKSIGIRFELHAFPNDVPEVLLIETIAALDARDDIDAILVQLPLPKHLDPDRVIAAIAPTKDVDGFCQENAALFADGHPRVIPPLPFAIGEVLRATGLPLQGMIAAAVVKSDIFYTPVARILTDLQIIVRRVNPSEASAKTLSDADIVIIAAGKPGLLRAKMIKPGSIIIDVGANRVDNKLVGDVADDVREKAAFLSPVPGGVGPVTVAAVARNAVLLSAKRQGV